jgi:hypothetical protein
MPQVKTASLTDDAVDRLRVAAEMNHQGKEADDSRRPLGVVA